MITLLSLIPERFRPKVLRSWPGKTYIRLSLRLKGGSCNYSDPIAPKWVKRAVMPTPRFGGHIGALYHNGKIYCIGGRPSLRSWSNKNEMYDPSTDSWSTKARKPVAGAGMGACICNGKFYLIGGGHDGGYDAYNHVYDPINDSWESKAPVPEAREGYFVASTGGKVYAIGGCDATIPHSENYEYDPATDQWTLKANKPNNSGNAIAVAVNGKIYCIGGAHGNDVLKENWEYDPTIDCWTRKSDMPTARYKQAAIVRDDKIYVIGGEIYSSHTPLDTVEIYDPAKDTWETGQPLSLARNHFFAGIDSNGNIYAIGGWDNITIFLSNEFYSEQP